jgi:hypothetical protein
MFIVIPITIAAAFSTGSALVDPVPDSSALCSLKSNFLNLIHQADISVGKNFRIHPPRLISIFVSTYK